MNQRELVDEAVACTICADTLSVPRFLPCGHTLCDQCTWNIEPVSHTQNGTIVCPMCRSASRRDTGFTPNHAVVNLVQLASRDTTTVEQLVDSLGCATCDDACGVATAAAVAGPRGTPRILNCGHTLCQECVVERLNNDAAYTQHMTIGCPLCYQVSHTQGDFPINFQIADLFRLSASRRRVQQMRNTIARQLATIGEMQTSAAARGDHSCYGFMEQLRQTSIILMNKLSGDENGSSIDDEDDTTLDRICRDSERLQSITFRRHEPQFQLVNGVRNGSLTGMRFITPPTAHCVVRAPGHPVVFNNYTSPRVIMVAIVPPSFGPVLRWH